MDMYPKKNLPLRNALAKVHVDSDFYAVASFIQNGNSLPLLDQKLLGDVKSKKILHLQCHLGLESISLAKLGAQVTAVDFSSSAITIARDLNTKMGTDVTFIEDDVYNLLDYALLNQFDIVYASYGVITWLPDLARWAELIYRSLKKSGKFILIEFHPQIFTLDDQGNIEADYGSKIEPDVYQMQKSYTGDPLDKAYSEYNWNHSTSQVISALLSSQLTLTHFEEYEYSPYDCFNNLVQRKDGHYQLKKFEQTKFPHLFSIIFEKLNLTD